MRLLRLRTLSRTTTPLRDHMSRGGVSDFSTLHTQWTNHQGCTLRGVLPARLTLLIFRERLLGVFGCPFPGYLLSLLPITLLSPPLAVPPFIILPPLGVILPSMPLSFLFVLVGKLLGLSLPLVSGMCSGQSQAQRSLGGCQRVRGQHCMALVQPTPLHSSQHVTVYGPVGARGGRERRGVPHSGALPRPHTGIIVLIGLGWEMLDIYVVASAWLSGNRIAAWLRRPLSHTNTPAPTVATPAPPHTAVARQ